MTYEITIGIPIYNKEKYIALTLETALAQTYQSIEFLVLDDRGTDGSMDIVREYQQTHPRGKDIRIVSQPHNMGIGEARNRILEEARGKYLFFLDADDTITSDTIEILVNVAKDYDAQMVMASYEKIDYYNDTINRNCYVLPFRVFQEENSLACYAFHKYGALQANIWNILMDLTLIRECGLRFVNTNYWEDMVFKYSLVTYVSRAVLLPNMTYQYRCHENSLSNTQNDGVALHKSIFQNVATIDVMKMQWKRVLSKPYFPDWLNFVIRTDYYIVCYTLKNEQRIIPFIRSSDLRNFLYSPLSLYTTLRYGTIQSLFYKILSQLPAPISIGVIRILQHIF